ncbi:PREDICTED: pentatricopeptide repeat-containing protein At4g14190, chloroplastic [Tarenaya hassleriana]|uniref:pentatricopeptide repeat-containing protein At4g14190, chloroplastic n=1 Tax=Tarenaya hassleriana TaxID=28532 RepID=UPI00053C7127|nr:PREDICTED: pentatricopeptide repeat-containing protein At4g14190, chloroplastic [Tarenaya hassleriana]
MENLTSQFQFIHFATLQQRPPWKPNKTFSFSSSKTLNPDILRCIPPSSAAEATSPAKHTTMLVESYHEHRYLSSLLRRLCRRGSCPLRLLQEDGDWSKDHFWAIVRFLHHSSRFHEILPVFDAWKDIERSRISESNYERIICLLCKESMMDEAIRAVRDMNDYGVSPSLKTYNSIIRGFAYDGKFEDAMFYMNQMRENGLLPVTETYDGLIEAYGKYNMYDEIVTCLKKMESDGCFPDQVTYNLLVREFSRGGLLKRMERIYRVLMSRRMTVEPSTLIAMLDAYAEFRVLRKMEDVYRKIYMFGISLDEDLVRKLANIYIDNLMFSRLEDLGHGLSSRTCWTDLGWCLRLLSHACLVSQKGLDSIMRDMEEANVRWNTNFANIVLLAYSKIGNFKLVKSFLSEIRTRNVKPDLVTIGIIFDLTLEGFDGTGVFMTWKEMGFLDRPAEMNTDPLVLAAFGKGEFLGSCEEVFRCFDPAAKESKSWTYQYIMEVVVKHRKTWAKNVTSL